MPEPITPAVAAPPVAYTEEQLGALIASQLRAAGVGQLTEPAPVVPPATPQVDLRASVVSSASTPAPVSNGWQAEEPLNFTEGVSPALHTFASVTPPLYRPERDQVFKGQTIAQFVRCMVKSQHSLKGVAGYISPVQVAKNLYGESHPITTQIHGAVTKAVDSTTGSKGAVLIPPGVTNDFIALLRPESTYLSAGPSFIGNPTGNLPIPKQVGGASAGYITEGTAIPVSQASFGQESAVSRHLAAMTVISNTWLDRVDAGQDALILADLLAAHSQKLDSAALRSTGAGGEIKGVRWWANPLNVLTAETLYLDETPVQHAQKVGRLLGKMWLAIVQANIVLRKPVWFMSARSYEFLDSLRDGNGNLIYADMLERGVLKRKPVSWTNQIPDDLGAGDDSEIYLVDMAQMIFADEKSVSIDTSSEAAIQDGATLTSLFSLDQSAIRLISRHDSIARYDRAIAVATAVNWGGTLVNTP